MSLSDAEALDEIQLVVGLDPLDCGSDLEGFRQLVHKVDELRPLAGLEHLLGEGTVDLQFIEREEPEIVDRREAGTEIIKRNAHTA